GIPAPASVPLAAASGLPSPWQPPQTPFNPQSRSKCRSVVDALIRKDPNEWYLHSPAGVANYDTYVSHPMWHSEIKSNLNAKGYPLVEDFLRDARRVAGNALRYRLGSDDIERDLAPQIWDVATELLDTIEERVIGRGLTDWPLASEWRECLQLLDALMQVKEGGGQALGQALCYSPKVSFGGEVPDDYRELCGKPLTFAMLISELVEGRIRHAGAFVSGLASVLLKCRRYWSVAGHKNAKLVSQAARLQKQLELEVPRRLPAYMAALAAASKDWTPESAAVAVETARGAGVMT
ncbi:unnamed protein product, partial [Phaeothamnion confervicola]